AQAVPAHRRQGRHRQGLEAAHALRTLRRLETLPVPTLAAVRGYCLGGGCELAMSCDWIVAGDDAVFGLPEVGLGVIPGAGGTQRLSRLVGRARAMEWITTGRNVKAEEALRVGLVNHVFPASQVLEEALAAARTVAAKGPVAVRLAKEAVQRGQDLDLENACAMENQLFGLCFATADQREGMTAFVEKRAPGFQGR
ncbi:MAG: enoyl-CoA hydratase/isomerase family protein, partial [Proteobacteria bacterium]|nr:enoyl-CoA hydratase/isomerase family protein [Pseudomonadota bacterium]